MGVKQGCKLSPLLFAIFLDDICDFMCGGLNVAGIEIKLLMYADDIVLLAPNPEALQQMINRLEEYCNMWNLTVNLEKSKIMIFGKNGKRSIKEKWLHRGLDVEIVNEYSYLGITLTPQLSFKKHLSERLIVAKQGINVTWGSLVTNSSVPFTVKMKLFKAVSRSIMCYGCQVWGGERKDEVEILQRYFLKRLLKLPANTPDYMLILETNCSPIYYFTLRLHFKYILKVLNYSENRIPKLLAKEIIREKIFWFANWVDLADSCKCSLGDSIEDVPLWKDQLFVLVEELERLEYINMVSKAQSGQLHQWYGQLNYSLEDSYLSEMHSINMISCIFRTRGSLINLNYCPWRRGQNQLCSLCNLNVIEDMYHFLAVCPILGFIRLRYFGNRILKPHEVVHILNGQSWRDLYLYVSTACRLRNGLIQEFNF